MEGCPFQLIRFCFKILQVQECVVRKISWDSFSTRESPRKRAVCGDWMVGAPALEPGTRRPLCADSVEKVENRTTPKISRKSIYSVSIATRHHSADTKVPGRFCVKRCGPFTSPRAIRISGPKKFRSSAEKDFFNNIRQKRTLTAWADFAREAGPTGRRDPIGPHAELVVASLAMAGRIRARMPAAFFRDPQSRSAAR
jgi:hypothetical protein